LDPSLTEIFIIGIIPFLLLLSAFFSGSETAYFSIDKATQQLLETDDKLSSKRVLKLLSEPQALLITILIGNNITNVIVASLTTLISQRIATFYDINLTLILIFNVGFITFLILLAGEIFPKVLAVRDNVKFAKKTSFMLQVFIIIFKPISFILYKLTTNLTEILDIKLNQGLTEEEVKTLLDISEENGSIQNDEKEMLSSILEFSETTVKEIMVPRIDMSCIQSTDSIQNVIQLINDELHSRIPVYEDRIDNITGIIYAKDLIKHLHKLDDISVNDILHTVHFVPEQKKIQELLKEFQDKKIHMAVVVDEYGGTSGLVTLEDIIEEIVGEIQDEYDSEDPLYIKIDETNFILDGRLSIEEFNENSDFQIDEQEGIETISGFIHNLTGNLPTEKDIITFQNLEFTIEEIDGHSISKIKLKILLNDLNR